METDEAIAKDPPADSQTFEAIARAWRANREEELDPAHADRVLRRLDRDAFPALGRKPITAITAPEIRTVIRKIDAPMPDPTDMPSLAYSTRTCRRVRRPMSGGDPGGADRFYRLEFVPSRRTEDRYEHLRKYRTEVSTVAGGISQWRWPVTNERESTRRKRRKRTPEDARSESLAAARALLLSDGPSAVTLANVGRASGMSHTNIIHHFGSAGELQSDLMGSMVRDLMVALDEVVGRVQVDATAPQAIIGQVFDAFDEGGGGQLAAWLVLSREFDHLEPIRQAVNDLVVALSEKFPGAPDVDARMRSAVLLIAVSAFGDAVIGPHLREMLGLKPDAMRAMITRILPFFYLAG